MDHSHDFLWPDGITWRVVPMVGRAIAYEFSHPTLGELGHIVIRPVAEGSDHCKLECQCVAGGTSDAAAMRRAYLISLGEYIRKVFEKRYADETATDPPVSPRLH
jgi:hypothetical protein